MSTFKGITWKAIMRVSLAVVVAIAASFPAWATQVKTKAPKSACLSLFESSELPEPVNHSVTRSEIDSLVGKLITSSGEVPASQEAALLELMKQQSEASNLMESLEVTTIQVSLLSLIFAKDALLEKLKSGINSSSTGEAVEVFTKSLSNPSLKAGARQIVTNTVEKVFKELDEAKVLAAMEIIFPERGNSDEFKKSVNGVVGFLKENANIDFYGNSLANNLFFWVQFELPHNKWDIWVQYQNKFEDSSYLSDTPKVLTAKLLRGDLDAPKMVRRIYSLAKGLGVKPIVAALSINYFLAGYAGEMSWIQMPLVWLGIAGENTFLGEYFFKGPAGYMVSYSAGGLSIMYSVLSAIYDLDNRKVYGARRINQLWSGIESYVRRRADSFIVQKGLSFWRSLRTDILKIKSQIAESNIQSIDSNKAQLAAQYRLGDRQYGIDLVASFDKAIYELQLSSGWPLFSHQSEYQQLAIDAAQNPPSEESMLEIQRKVLELVESSGAVTEFQLLQWDYDADAIFNDLMDLFKNHGRSVDRTALSNISSATENLSQIMEKQKDLYKVLVAGHVALSRLANVANLTLDSNSNLKKNRRLFQRADWLGIYVNFLNRTNILLNKIEILDSYLVHLQNMLAATTVEDVEHEFEMLVRARMLTSEINARGR